MTDRVDPGRFEGRTTDPGSWEVRIDTLLTAITITSQTVTGFIRLVRSARNDLVQVSRELSDLRLELELLRGERDVPRQIQTCGRPLLDSCGAVLRRISSLLGGPSPSSPPPRPDRAADASRPARWSVKERFQTSNLCNCVQIHREALALLHELANLRSTQDGADGEEAEEKANEILDAISDLQEAIPQAEPAIGEARQVLELYLSALANHINAIRGELPQSPGEGKAAAEVSKSKPSRQLSRGEATMSPAWLSLTRKKSQPQLDASPTAPGSTGSDGGTPDPNGQWSLEAVGPWFPSSDVHVPFYNNQEQVLQHRANSYHVPRSPAPHSPLPHPPPSSPPLPPPKSALPMLPPTAPRSKAQRHVAELPGTDTREVRHVAQYYNPNHQRGHPDSHHRNGPEPYHARHQSSPIHHQGARSPHSVDHAVEGSQRHRAASEQPYPHPPQPSDSWATSVYVPSTPPSGQSSQRTSFQPSSLDSVPSRDTYRSSVSTGQYSAIDSLSPSTSPRTQLQATFESTVPLPVRPPSPQPSTSRSSGSVSVKGSSLLDKIPGVRRAKRKSLSGSADQGAYRSSVSSGSSSTVEQTPVGGGGRRLIHSPVSGSQTPLADDHVALMRRSQRQVEIVPAEGLSDGKGPAIHHLEISPTCSVIATQHSNNTVKVWSITTGAVDGLIKYSSKVQAGPRSRMYFLRPHAVMSENSTLVAITASFGNTIEFWNWTKKKRIQTIDHAARWACVPGDVFEANMRPLAVYRSESDRIDLYTATRDAKKPFVESRRINLKDADLPFVPKFPDLAYSATGPLLVGAAGPRPGAPPESQQTILLAWQIDETQDNPRPYRWVVPDHAELNGALPACVATYGSVAVSIWFPANYKHIMTTRGENKKIPIQVTSRHVLVWDLATNRTRMFSIPNVLSCVSPDCRYLAYCDPEQGRFVVMDITSGAEIWSGPDELDIRQGGGSAAASGQLLGDLSNVTEFRFTEDSGLLFVADQDGGVGIYEVRQTGGNGRAGSVSTTSGPVSARYDFSDMRQTLERKRTGDSRS